MKTKYFAIFIGLMLSLTSSVSYATNIDLSVYSAGSYALTESTTNDKGKKTTTTSYSSSSEYIAGVDSDNSGWPKTTTYYNSWVVFDLSALIDQNITSITSATLSFSTVRHSGTYTLFDVSSDIDALESETDDFAEYYEDLGSGTLFSSILLQNSDTDDIIQITLNQDALNSLNEALSSLTQYWALGGTYTDYNANEAAGSYITISAESLALSVEATSSSELVSSAATAIPEPDTLFLFSCSIVLLTLWQYKYNKKDKTNF